MSDAAADQAARELLARYALHIDARDWEGFRSLFHPDAEFPGFRREAIQGVDAWLAFVEKQIGHFDATQHHIGLAVVSAEAGGLRVRAPLRAEHFTLGTDRQTFTVYGRYDTRIEARPDGGFWIRSHRLDVLTHETRALGS